MRHVFPLLLAMACAVPAYAATESPLAQQPQSSAYQQNVKSADSVKDAAEGTIVILEGTITNQLQDDFYMFKDASGDVLVEIDEDIIGNRKVAPGSKVHLTGKVDKRNNNQAAVEVDELQILN